MTMDTEEAEAILAPDWDRSRRRRKKKVLVALAATAVGVLALASVLAFLQVFQGWDEGARLAPSPQPSPSVEVAPRWPIEPGQFAAGAGATSCWPAGQWKGRQRNGLQAVVPHGMERWGHREGGEDLAQEPQDCGWGDRQGGARGPAGRGERSGPERGPGVGTHGGPQLPGDEVPGVRRGWPRRDRLPAGSGQQARRSRHPILRGQLEVRRGRDQMVDFSPTAPARTGADQRTRPGLRPDWAERDGQGVRGQEHALFFTDEGAREVQGPRARAAGEGEPYSGVVYKEDPTIFAWNLINEPRCESWLVEGCEGRLQGWIEEMSAYVKLLDPNHLVTVGGEGFYAGPGSNSEGPTGDLPLTPRLGC